MIFNTIDSYHYDLIMLSSNLQTQSFSLDNFFESKIIDPEKEYYQLVLHNTKIIKGKMEQPISKGVTLEEELSSLLSTMGLVV